MGSEHSENVRDHLANERTFLAWIRTALALLGLGFVLARMGFFLRAVLGGIERSEPMPRQAGGEFLATGIVFCVIGTGLAMWAGYHCHQSRRAIDRGQYRPASRSTLTISAFVVIGGIIIVSLLLARSNAAFGF
jgi:putative membrane protein